MERVIRLAIWLAIWGAIVAAIKVLPTALCMILLIIWGCICTKD